MTTKVDLQSKILAHVSQIAGNYGVHIGTNLNSEIMAENFENAGKLTAFIFDVDKFMKTLKLRSFSINTTYNPYEVKINWRDTTCKR